MAGKTSFSRPYPVTSTPTTVENSDSFPEEAPRGRWATFDDLAQVMLFFLDPDSEYISGQNVKVDGGWLPETV